MRTNKHLLRTMKEKCEKCEGELEYKFNLDDSVEDFSPTEIYQCEKCKDIIAR